jgi:all-trans-retinol 13,14-reductase
LYFGCRTLAENITASFTTLPRTVLCVSRGQKAPDGVQGRVTQALTALAFDPKATDFYVCGSAAMVAECRTILERAGAARILIEPY